LTGYNIDFALRLITGNPSFSYNVLSDEIRFRIADNSFWLELQGFVEKGFLCGGVTLPSEELPRGYEAISGQYGYAILDAFELDGKKLLQLSNPKGVADWNGSWALNSRKWTSRFKGMVLQRFIKRKSREKKIKEKPLILTSVSKELFNDKSFFVSWEEFIKCFEIVFASISFDNSWSYIRILDRWSEKHSIGSTFCLDLLGQNPQYLLRLSEGMEVFFLLILQLPVSEKKVRKIGFSIHKYEGKLVNENGVVPSLVAIGRYSAEKAISLNCTLNEGEYVILVTAYEIEQDNSFTLTMWYPKKNNKSIYLSRHNN